jgi:hypothetical protein
MSAVCATEVIVVRAPSDPVDLCCGGHPMLPCGERPSVASPAPAHSSGTLLGKRYAAEDVGMELLCSKAGEGSLSLGDLPLSVKSPKPLPSSD